MKRLAITVAALAVLTTPSLAADQLKATLGQRGNWDTAVIELGTKAGIFKKHDLEIETVYTSGSGETLQPVISGSVDMGFAVGTLGAMAAYAKGAPVRIIGAEATGAADYWYAKASSPIKSIKDADGHSIAYSTNGSSTNSVMPDQVEIGWAAPPFGLKELAEGKIHVVAKATDAALVRGQTIRVIVANA